MKLSTGKKEFKISNIIVITTIFAIIAVFVIVIYNNYSLSSKGLISTDAYKEAEKKDPGTKTDIIEDVKVIQTSVTGDNNKVVSGSSNVTLK